MNGDGVKLVRVADRLRLSTMRKSLLLRRLSRLRDQYPSSDATCLADWLLDVANARGAGVVSRSHEYDFSFNAPPEEVLPTEDLVAALCHPLGPDRPQILRLAAQFISRGGLNWSRLKLRIAQERLGPIIGELARQALKVEPEHQLWKMIADSAPAHYSLPSPVLHWNRLAWPVRQKRRSCRQEWELVR